MSISVVVTARTIFAHEFEQTRGDSGGQEAWCAAVHEGAKSWT